MPSKLFQGCTFKGHQRNSKTTREEHLIYKNRPFYPCERNQTDKTYSQGHVFEAIEIEKLGLKVEYLKPDEMEFPDELEVAFKKDPVFETAFKKLTSGRQKGYLLFISRAKQSTTRVSRIEKYRSRIMAGKGIHDCVCGHSQKMPSCDGSHKYI